MEGARELSKASFIRALIPFVKAPPSWPYELPKTPPPDSLTLGVRFQHRIWRNMGIQSVLNVVKIFLSITCLSADMLHFYDQITCSVPLWRLSFVSWLRILPHLEIKKKKMVLCISSRTLSILYFAVSALIWLSYVLCQMWDIDLTFSSKWIMNCSHTCPFWFEMALLS